jgi:threonine/homoserine/homoserine lactone efflux protein
MIVNVLNPKVTIFFLAFLPQFGNGPAELLVLGLIYTVIAVISDGVYALLAGGIGDRLRRRPQIRRRIERGSGVIYILLGTGAAVEG